MYVRKFIFNFIADLYCRYSAVFAAVLLCFHLYQFNNSGFMLEPLIRVIFCGLFIVSVVFFGRNAIPYLFLVFGFTIEQFSDFSNYTAIFIIALFLILHRGATIPVLIAYTLDVLIVCEHHDKSTIHLAIHFINCVFILLCVQIIFSISARKIKESTKRLILDDTDRAILEQLSKGAKQKEINGYSENTVSKRLRKMRIKNYCETNAELLQRFISE